MPIISSGQITITDLNDGYTLSITGGNRTFSYASSGTTPAPATSGTFGFTLFRGGTSITPSAYSWAASGVLSGTSTTSTFQPTLSNTYSVATPTTVTLTVTHEGNSLTTTVSVLVSQAPSNAIIDTIFVSAPAIYKDVADAATTGTYTTTTIQGRRYNGATTSNFGWITVTPNTTGTESARTDTSTTALTLTPATTSGVSSYIIRLYAAASGGTAVTSQTLNVVFKGAVGSPGNNGTSPVLYELGLSAAVIARSSSNVLAPTSLVVSGFSTTAGTKSAYPGRFKIYEDAVLKYTSSADQSTYTYTPTVGTIGLLKTELYAAGGTTTLLDTQEVPVVVSGSSAMTFSLTNSAYPIPADNAGAVATYTGSGTSIQVLEGSEVYTYVTTLGTTAKTFSIGTPTLSVASAITVGARSGATTTTAVVADHSAMSNSVDAVVISYPLTYIRANGATGTQTVTQTVTKVKAGTLGIRGSRQLYSTDVAYTSTYDFDGAGATAAGAASYAARASQLIATAAAGSNPTTPINGDTVTFSNGTNYVYTITHNGTTWSPPGTVIDGSLLVTGSVAAAKINSNGLSVRDSAGAIILDAGNSTINSTLSMSAVTGAGFRAGSLTWDATGARTSGQGVAMTPGGLIGHNGTKTTFAVNATTGAASFGGNLDAAGGTFNGSLSVGTTPAISGTTMTGSGAVINSTGSFALGTSTGNITFNGTQLTINGDLVTTGNIKNEAVSTFKLARGAALPDYVRTYKGGVTPTVPLNTWMALQLDATALNNKLGAVDYDAYRTLLPAGTYFYELSVPVKCQGSDTNDACYTAIISNPPGTPSGTTQTVCGNVSVIVGSGKDAQYTTEYQCWQEYVPTSYTVLSTAGVNVVGDWQTATVFGVGRFTLVNPAYVSAAIKTTDSFPTMVVVGRTDYSSTILRIWRDLSV